MAEEGVRIHLRRGMGSQDDLNIVHGYNKPLSLNRLRQAKDEFALARIRRREKGLQEQEVSVRVHRYEEPLGAPGWKDEGGGARRDMIVPISGRGKYREYMGKLLNWTPGQITQSEQAEALPSETRVISDAGGRLEDDLIQVPFDQAPVGGWRGIPMQRGVEMPEEMVSVGRPPWMGALGSLAQLPTTDPTYALDVVSVRNFEETGGGQGLELKVKTKKDGRLFFVYAVNFKDGTRYRCTSDVVQVPVDTSTALTAHIPPAAWQDLKKRRGESLTGVALTVYATQGIFGIRRKMIAQQKQGQI